MVGERGVTLVELVVMLVIVGSLATLAVVVVEDVTAGFRQRAATSEAYGRLHAGRLQAIGTGGTVAVSIADQTIEFNGYGAALACPCSIPVAGRLIFVSKGGVIRLADGT